MPYDTWEEISFQILNEMRKKRKLDQVEKYSFLIILSQNTEKLMEEKGYLHYEKDYVRRQCSKSEFLKKLRVSNPIEYRKLIRISLNPESGSQKGHSYLKKATQHMLEQKGYNVYDIDKTQEREKAIKKLRKLNKGYLVAICQGKDRYPDLVAFKGKEYLIVEVVSRKNRLVRQLDRYQMAGETWLILPIATEDLKILGTSQVYNET